MERLARAFVSASSDARTCAGCGASSEAPRCEHCGVASQAGGYRILGVLAQGPRGRTYLARDSEGRSVALKELVSALVPSTTQLEDFEREVAVLSRLQHPRLPRVLGGFHEGFGAHTRLYLAQEHVPGESLVRELEHHPFTEEEVRGLAQEVLEALEYLHGHSPQVLHRDLKPANLMLEPSPGPVERVVLIDFGYAAMTGQSRLTRQGHVVGSLAYVPPERIMGAVGDARADLYGLAIILYELIAGRRPFVADSEAELISMQLETQPPPPSVIAPDAGIPVAFDLVVLRAMQKQPEARYASAAEMATAIEAAMSALP